MPFTVNGLSVLGIDLYEHKGRTLSGACGTIFDVLLLLEIFVEECIRYFLVGAS